MSESRDPLHAHGTDESFVRSVEIETLRLWHEWEHNPRWPNAKHAHDEFTARRRSVEEVLTCG